MKISFEDFQRAVKLRANLDNMARDILKVDSVEKVDSIILERAIIRETFPHITEEKQKTMSIDAHQGYLDAAAYIYNRQKQNGGF